MTQHCARAQSFFLACIDQEIVTGVESEISVKKFNSRAAKIAVAMANNYKDDAKKLLHALAEAAKGTRFTVRV